MKITKLLRNLDFYIAAVLVAILVLLTGIGIVLRYFFNRPFAWLEEITSLCFLWSILLGAAGAIRTKEHVTIEILVERFSKKNQRIIEVFVVVVTALLLIYLTFQAVLYLGTVIGAHRRTGLLRLPYGIIYGMLPVSTVLKLINLLFAFRADLCAWKIEDSSLASSAANLDKEVEA
jgi:TRAP-type C4-dicarboxylate transport system permease small subunit